MSQIIEAQSKDIFFEELIYKLNAQKNYRDLIHNFDLTNSCYSNEIINKIDSIVFGTCKDEFHKVIPNNKSLYRARVIDVNDERNTELGFGFDGQTYRGYNEKNSRECPLLVGGNGRNNIPGQSYLYVAEDEKTACAEVKSGLRSLISLAEFKTKRALQIIDFSQDITFDEEWRKKYEMSLGTFFTNLMMSYSVPVASEREYKITQIISDHIRKSGIDGIAYKSFYTGKTNYTIFNCHPMNIEFVGSRLLAHQYMISSFWDFTKKVAIKSYEDDIEYNEEIAQEILRELGYASIKE